MPSDACTTMAICSDDPEARAELANAVWAGRRAFVGVRSAIIELSGGNPSPHGPGPVVDLADGGPEGWTSLLRIRCIGERVNVVVGHRAEIDNAYGDALREWWDSHRDDAEDLEPDVLPHSLASRVATEGPCWVHVRSRGEAEPGEWRLAVDHDVQATREFFASPATRGNSNPVAHLLLQLGLDPLPVEQRPHQGFVFVAYLVPIVVILGLSTWWFDFSIATGLAGVVMGFALSKPWAFYTERVRGHMTLAAESGQSPWSFLRTMLRFAFGRAVHKERSGQWTHRLVSYAGHVQTSRSFQGADPPPFPRRSGHVEISRPRFLFHRYYARRSEVWWENHVSPVHGSCPPAWVVHLAGRCTPRRLALQRFRLRLWRLQRVLMLESASEREALDVLDRFRDGVTLENGSKPLHGHRMTARYAARMTAGLLGR